MGPDYSAPPSSALIQNLIKATNASTFDITGSCSSVIWAIHTAIVYISQKIYKRVRCQQLIGQIKNYGQERAKAKKHHLRIKSTQKESEEHKRKWYDWLRGK